MPALKPTRRELCLADLQALTDVVRTPGEPFAIFQAIEKLTAEVIGHRLFTIMRFDAARFEVERVYTSDPAVYPLGGRKRKERTAWGEHVLTSMRAFRANKPKEIRAAFDDHATLAMLGIGAILNIPIALQGRCLGTMNLCHEAGWFTPHDEQAGLLLAAFALPALL